MIGRSFSHYRVLDVLGAGGAGTVYRAEDTLLGRPVALKFPHRDALRDASARERFLREARIASVLDHPNIVVVFDVGEDRDEIFIAMQLAEGHTLRERLRAGPPPLAETLATGRAVADALAHAHARGVLHRDIKPENVIVGGDGRVKMTDFGIARRAGETRLTEAGTLQGTWAYLAPEVIRGEGGDARSDLYALGAMLYEMCSGRPPFTGDRAETVLYRAVNDAPAPLPAATPPALSALVESLLAKDPERRPASAVEVADTLLHLTAPRAAAGVAAPRAAVPARSIAVLDFANLTGDPEDDYFSAGVTEDLLTDLLKIPDLKVASRSAVQTLRGRALDSRGAGRELGVATVLEGSLRRAGDRVRVTAQLVQADSGYQLWAERYDRGLADIFEVQEDIARRIADALRLAFDPEDVEGRPGRRTRNPRAYDLRLQALALYRRFEEAAMRQAIALLAEALREDPDYALARADYAESLVQMPCKGWDLSPAWLDRAEEEARLVIARAPQLAEGHRVLGHVRCHRRTLGLALRDFHHAHDLDPRAAGPLVGLANNYIFLGDPTRAEIYARRAVSLDPEDPRGVLLLATSLLRQRRFDECRAVARGALASVRAHLYRVPMIELLMLAASWQGDAREVARLGEEFARDPVQDAQSRAVLALAEASAGRADEARRLLAQDRDDALDHNTVLVSRARVHLLLGEREAALAALTRASALDVVDLHELRIDPQFATLAGEPRYERIFAAQS
ncbi:MAG: protein kinase [Candidatus Eisenbacteria bacterium]|nr:protein kinase [Candidatus Eisenbacteria bacterium]